MSDLINQFVNRTNDSLLTNIGAGANQLVQGFKAKEAKRVATETYNTAYDAYMANPNKETLGAMYSASQPLGIFDNMVETVKGMDTLQNNQELKHIGQYYSTLYSGNEDIFISNMEADILANETDGNPENDGKIQEMKTMISKVKDGKGNEVIAQLGSAMGMFDGGSEMMDNVNSMNADLRAEEKAMSDLITAGTNIEYDSPEHKQHIEEISKKLRNPEVAGLVAEMGRVKTLSDGMTSGQLDTAARSWRQQYFKETTDWRDALKGAEHVKETGTLALQQADDPTTREVRNPITGELVTIVGPANIAFMNSFQRLIDPATVRQGDIDLMRSTVGGVDKAEAAWNNFWNGEKLTTDQITMMMEVSEEMMQAYAKQEQDSREVVLANTRDLGIPDKKVVGAALLKNYLDTEEEDEKVVTEAGTGGEGNMGATPEEVANVKEYFLSLGDDYWTAEELKELKETTPTLERLKEMAPNAFDKYNKAPKTKETPVVPTTGIYGLGS